VTSPSKSLDGLAFRGMHGNNVPPRQDSYLVSVLAGMVRRPISAFLLRWNWKSAIVSAAYRAPIFFAVSVRHGIRMATAGVLVEAGFNAVGAGFYGAFLESVRNAQPAWLASLLATCAVPVLTQIVLNLVHYAAGTSVLHRGIILSILLSALSAAFNLYVMRRGAMLTGNDAEPFQRDLARLPVMIGGFLMILPRSLVRMFRKQDAGRGDKRP
jgi:hypothetical protein